MDDLHSQPLREWGGNAEEILAELPAAILIVNGAGEVTFANSGAVRVFAPLYPVGLALTSLLGLSGTANGSALLAAAAAGDYRAAIRIDLPDGRILDATLRPLHGGGVVLTLVDVTSYVNTGERAACDSLTGLATRAGLHERLNDLLANAGVTGTSIAVVCIDLDRFKAVNDTLGHPVGDALLIKVAERLRAAARASDIVVRMGGDEFAVIQTNAHQPHGAEVLAKRLVDLIGRTYVVGGNMLNIGASVGIALSPTDGNDTETLLRHADLALYRAKSGGRGAYRFFTAAMDSEMQSRRLLEIALRRALALKQFELLYQPQMRIETGEVVGFEALLRWRDPQRGIVSPAEFITLAEEIGLMIPIGAWVLHTACQEAASWTRPVAVAVNISPLQFRGDKLVQTVRSALEASGLDPTRLDLEITEGVLLDNTVTVLNVLRELKAIGVRISMDDFGTGYSSLSYLLKFPFDKIKIDQSFVRGSDANTDCDAIVRAVTALASSLGMKTVAEGVETTEQLARIRQAGCGDVQGYLTGRPLSPAQIATILDVPARATECAPKELSGADQ